MESRSASDTTKPTFDELKKYIKEMLDLNEPELKLIDSISYYLDNFQVVGNEDLNAKLPQTEHHKRNILAGAILFVRNEINSSSPSYAKLVAALSTFDSVSEEKALAEFARYFVQFNLADVDSEKSKSLNGIYTLKRIIDDIPNGFVAEIRDQESPVIQASSQPPSQPSPSQLSASNASFLYRWTWGFFGSNVVEETTVISEPVEKEEQTNVVSLTKSR